MEKDHYSIVFVVLVYRNTCDLKDFFANYKIRNSHVIVVNSYYDDSTEQEFKKVSTENNASFLSVPNEGYGAGNNRGIEYAINNFDFEYLVISNADILIEDFDIIYLNQFKNSIIAPRIVNLNGKQQNPSSPFKPTLLNEHFKYFCYINNHRHLIYVLYALSRFKKILFHCIKRFRKKIFSAHGAFVILPKQVLLELSPLYNEQMFLFNEEEYLGRLAESKKISTYYLENIKVLHKEDGSMSVSNVNYFEQMKRSYVVYYNKWIKK